MSNSELKMHLFRNAPYAEKEMLLQWESFPLRDYPPLTFALLAVLAVIEWGLYEITVVSWGQPGFYLLGSAFLFFSLISYFIPTVYRIDDQAVYATYICATMIRPLGQFHCFYGDKKGILLGTFGHPSRLDRFRGMSLRFSKTRQEKERLIDILKEKVGKQY